MEVHHHAHSESGTDSHRSKRKWTHYFWEFFMLFLAVFLGMLAEYRLEHIIEHQREKKYIRSLIRDLEMDISSLQNSYDRRLVQMNYFDSLHDLLIRHDKDRTNDMYFYARHINRHTNFQYHDRTIQQLKNSGNLRLIRNQRAADSLTVYDNEKMKSSMIQLDGEIENRRQITFNLSGKIFDSYTWRNMTDNTGRIIRPTSGTTLMTDDRATLNEFSFRLVTLRGTLFFTNASIESTIKSAKNLIALLKEEYRIK